MSASTSSRSSTVYIHEQAQSIAIYKSLVELGERYRQSSPAANLQCMLEGHLLLRTALNQEQGGADERDGAGDENADETSIRI